MSTPVSGVDILVEVGINYTESLAGDLEAKMHSKISNLFRDFINGRIKFQQAQAELIDLIGKDDPIVRVNEIMELPDEPLLYHGDDYDEDTGSTRRKTRTWSIAEDQRLLAGVYHFGLENWQAVSQYLGSGRNRAQCSQRWTRGLNPRISKKNWTPDEDEELERLVRIHGEKAWTKIASIMGNRSDVQCRYHYRQIISGGEPKCLSQRKTHMAQSIDRFILNGDGPTQEEQSPKMSEEENERISLSEIRGTFSMPTFRIGRLKSTLPGIPDLIEKAPGIGEVAMNLGQMELETFLCHFK